MLRYWYSYNRKKVNKFTIGNALNAGAFMPKMKTKKGAAKRFVVRNSGSIKRGQAFKRHILTKKTTKTKRNLRGSAAVSASDVQRVRSMLPYA